MNYQEFQKTCNHAWQEMYDWLHGLDKKTQRAFTPEEAFKVLLQEQASTLEHQLQFARRTIQDGRAAQTFMDDPFVQTLLSVLSEEGRGMAGKTIDTAKSMEEVAYARGWRDGSKAFFTKLNTLVRLGKGAESSLVDLTRQANT